MRNLLLIFISLFFAQSFSQTQKKTITELETIGYAIDSTLFNKNKDYFDSIYDMKSMANRFFINSEDTDVQKFNSEFYGGFSKAFSLGNEVIKAINTGSEYTFLRAYSKEGKYYLLFRLFGDQGLNYHRHLIKYINGEPKIIDTYVYITGEYLSQTIKVIYNVSLNSLNPLKRLLNNSELEDINTMVVIKRSLEQGEYQKVVDLYESLSKKSKNKKIFNLFVLTAAQYLSDDKYSKYINHYESQFPNDVSLYLISIDGFILKEQYDKALLSIDKLDAAIGKDDFLNYMRGNIYYLKKDYKYAIQKFNSITLDYPLFLDAYDSLLTVYVDSKDYDSAVMVLDIMINNFEVGKEDLEALIAENFTNFSNSTQFENWLNK